MHICIWRSEEDLKGLVPPRCPTQVTRLGSKYPLSCLAGPSLDSLIGRGQNRANESHFALFWCCQKLKSFKIELSEMKVSDPDILVIRNSYLEAKFKLRNRNVPNNESPGNAAVLGLILLGNKVCT